MRELKSNVPVRRCTTLLVELEQFDGWELEQFEAPEGLCLQLLNLKSTVVCGQALCENILYLFLLGVLFGPSSARFGSGLLSSATAF